MNTRRHPVLHPVLHLTAMVTGCLAACVTAVMVRSIPAPVLPMLGTVGVLAGHTVAWAAGWWRR